VSDPVFDLPRERDLAWPERPSSIGLLRRRDFRILFSAAATSELGDARVAESMQRTLRQGRARG